jgi:hypothetical protein
MGKVTSHLDTVFNYTPEQLTTIREALKEAGFTRDTDWARYLELLKATAQTAIAAKAVRANNPKLARRTAIKQLGDLCRALDALSPVVHAELLAAINNLPGGQGRFSLEYTRHAIDLLLVRWEAEGKPSVLPQVIRNIEAINSGVAALVRKAHAQHSPKPPSIFLRGRKRDEATHQFAFALANIYHYATGKVPSRTYDAYHERDTSPFYSFAKAALIPTGLVSNNKVDHYIREGLDAYRALVLPPDSSRCTTKVKSYRL